MDFVVFHVPLLLFLLIFIFPFNLLIVAMSNNNLNTVNRTYLRHIASYVRAKKSKKRKGVLAPTDTSMNMGTWQYYMYNHKSMST